MDMKKISCAVLIAVAATMNVALASEEVHAPAPAPTNAAGLNVPVLGSLVGASLVSILGFYLQ
ncbi:hypothetical protein C5167_045876 [Papaver somniferum]|uniref:Arabinogalactan peptide 23-like n=1 Tax=Papaver somniferum TaxID=3469 RepID=A0A4Y7LFU3_PAPSO|nr:arabinogalactan protein 23-like [Papaver somniferum]RZC77459.1 hypothetical protein C5167_001604 [Papaver somniferum]RZC83089.1 hypothetical protein C5167_045876 [Papaver somniferum]